MRLFAHPEVFLIMILMMIGGGYLFTLIQKKPKKKPTNPYRRSNERDDQP
jgi:hypothetical protein